MNFDSLFTVPIGDLILYFVAFILSLSIHEAAHATTSYWFGDDTARLQGRISNYTLVTGGVGAAVFAALGLACVRAAGTADG